VASRRARSSVGGSNDFSVACSHIDAVSPWAPGTHASALPRPCTSLPAVDVHALDSDMSTAPNLSSPGSGYVTPGSYASWGVLSQTSATSAFHSAATSLPASPRVTGATAVLVDGDGVGTSSARTFLSEGFTARAPRSAQCAFVAQVAALKLDIEPHGGHVHVSVHDVHIDGEEGPKSWEWWAAGGEATDDMSVPAWPSVLSRELPAGYPASPLLRAGSVPPSARSSAFGRPTPTPRSSSTDIGAFPFTHVTPSSQALHGPHTSHSHTQLARGALSHPGTAWRSTHGRRISADAATPMTTFMPPPADPPLLSLTSSLTTRHTRVSIQPLCLYACPPAVDYIIQAALSLRVGGAVPDDDAAGCALATATELPWGPARTLVAAEAATAYSVPPHSLDVSLDAVKVSLSLDPPAAVARRTAPDAWLEVHGLMARMQPLGSGAAVAAAADDLRRVQDREGGGWGHGWGLRATFKVAPGSPPQRFPLASLHWALAGWPVPTAEAALASLMHLHVALTAASVCAGVRSREASGSRSIWNLPSTLAHVPRPMVVLSKARATLRVPVDAFAPPVATVALANASASILWSDLGHAGAMQPWLVALHRALSLDWDDAAAVLPEPQQEGAGVSLRVEIGELVSRLTRDDRPSASCLEVILLNAAATVDDPSPTTSGGARLSPQMSVCTGEVSITSLAGTPADTFPEHLVHIPSQLRSVAAASLAVRVEVQRSDSALAALDLDVRGFSADLASATGALVDAPPTRCRVVQSASLTKQGLFQLRMTPAGPTRGRLHTSVLIEDMAWSSIVITHVVASVLAAFRPPMATAGPPDPGQTVATGASPEDDPFTSVTVAVLRCTVLATSRHLPPTIALSSNSVAVSNTAIELAIEAAHIFAPDAAISDIVQHPEALVKVLADAFAPSASSQQRHTADTKVSTAFGALLTFHPFSTCWLCNTAGISAVVSSWMRQHD
jgi:hypothetical protein